MMKEVRFTLARKVEPDFYFDAMVEAKTRRFAGIRPAHRPPHTR
ncbi:hypothetical protein ATSB10_03820 [Dyella thiooxydans]|uniref:Uncharacterized protein n=1 Tax=Dyella thiooxydans TaxID=445710 RepID=A0A160MXF4_9GAMM|nr:hypothetical protein ATSB10_03820 [Dyella thiooxydans]